MATGDAWENSTFINQFAHVAADVPMARVLVGKTLAQMASEEAVCR